MRTSVLFILSALCLALLSGCASGPEYHHYSREITGAFVADDGKLYLLPVYDEPMRFDAAPFRDYRALMDSPATPQPLLPARRLAVPRRRSHRPERRAARRSS